MIKTTKKRQAPPTVSTTAKQAKMGEVPSNWYLCENWQKYSDAINKEAQKLASFFNYEPEESIKKVCSKRKDFLCCHKCWIGSKFNKSTPIDELMPDAQSDNAVDVDATINYNNNNNNDDDDDDDDDDEKDSGNEEDDDLNDIASFNNYILKENVSKVKDLQLLLEDKYDPKLDNSWMINNRIDKVKKMCSSLKKLETPQDKSKSRKKMSNYKTSVKKRIDNQLLNVTSFSKAPVEHVDYFYITSLILKHLNLKYAISYLTRLAKEGLVPKDSYNSEINARYANYKTFSYISAIWDHFIPVHFRTFYAILLDKYGETKDFNNDECAHTVMSFYVQEFPEHIAELVKSISSETL